MRKRKTFYLGVAAVLVATSALAFEVGPGFEAVQWQKNARINFSEPMTFSPFSIYPSTTQLGSSNFTVEPENAAGLKIDHYSRNAPLQEYVANFSASSSGDVNFTIGNLPGDLFYEAFDPDTDERFFIGYTDSNDDFNFTVNSLDERNVSVLHYGEKGVEAENVSFNDTNPVENQALKVMTNVSNEGVVDSETVNLSVGVETFNGSEWVEEDFFSTVETVSAGGSILGNVTWGVRPGPWRFNVSLDPEDEIKETNESNNNASELLDVDSYQVLYGGSDSALVAGSEDRDIFRWDPEQDSGLIYLSDVDSSYEFSDLEPVSGSDLVEVDEALSLRGHNDSVQELWDSDGDGSVDRTVSWSVGNRELSVPVTDSTEGSPFETGILYDSGDGSGYNGSQDLVFVTEILPDTVGSYGTYDYEVRVPFSLGELRPGSDRIGVLSELE